MDILARYTRKLGGRGWGDWDGDRGATYHADDHGYTLCGRGEPDAPRNGTSGKGWERLRGRSNSDVTCAICRRKLGLPPLVD